MDSTDNTAPGGKVGLRRPATGFFVRLTALLSTMPARHRLAYLCLFLYPILLLQVKAGGSAMLALLMFSGIYILVKEKVKFDIKPIKTLYMCLVFFWFVDFLTAALSERAPVAGVLSSFTQIHFLLFPIFFLVLSRLCYGQQVFLAGMLLSILVSVGSSLYQFYNPVYPYGSRAHGGINPILFACILVVQIGLIALYAKMYRRRLLWVVVALGLIPLTLSLTRGAMLGLLSILIVLFLYSRPVNLNWLRSRTVFVVFLLVLAIFFVYGNVIKSRVDQAVEQTSSYFDSSDKVSSIGYRLAMYEGGMELISDNFWLGVGRNNVNDLLAETSVMSSEMKRITTYTHLHNEYLTTLAGSGVLGLASLLIILIMPWVFTHYYTDHLYCRSQVAVIVSLYATFGLTNLAFDNGTMNGMYVMVLALALANKDKKISV